LVKFALKYSVIAWLQRRKAAKLPPALTDKDGELLQRTTSRHESLYSNRTTFLNRARGRLGLKKGQRIDMSGRELSRFSSIQAQQSGAALQRAASRA
jgi:H+-transporting ATPase